MAKITLFEDIIYAPPRKLDASGFVPTLEDLKEYIRSLPDSDSSISFEYSVSP